MFTFTEWIFRDCLLDYSLGADVAKIFYHNETPDVIIYKSWPPFVFALTLLLQRNQGIVIRICRF